MRILLSEQLDYFRENTRDISAILDLIIEKVKRVGALILNSYVLLWIPFFLLLTLLINVIQG